MIKWFYKYGFILLLLNTILANIGDKTSDFEFLSSDLFWPIMPRSEL